MARLTGARIGVLRALGVCIVVMVSACSGDDSAESGQTTTTTTTTVASSTTTPAPPEPLGEAELQAVVADTWQAIWVRDWEAVIAVYDTPCRERLTPSVFDSTLGAGIDALTQGGIDPTATDVKVQVEDLIEDESASVVTLLTFDGFSDAEEDDTGDWVVEDGAWRRVDCDDLVGAASAAEGVVGPGSIEDPAAFDSVFEFEGWRGTITDVIDAEPFLAGFSGEPAEGEQFLMIVAELQHLGSEFAIPDPFLVRAQGSDVWESFDTSCALDPSLTAAEGLVVTGSFLPGETLRIVNCVAVPSAEVESATFVLENAFGISDAEIHFRADGSPTEPLTPVTVDRPDPSAGAVSFGTTADVGAVPATVLSIHDGVAEGLLAGFSQTPPEGFTHAVVIWEFAHDTETVPAMPFFADVLGSRVHDGTTWPCGLNSEAIAAIHGPLSSEDIPAGETGRGAQCFTVPVDELGTVVVQLQSALDFDAETVRFAQP